MHSDPLLLCSPLIVMLCWAAAHDLRHRRIRNELVLIMAMTGLMQSVTSFGTLSPCDALLGLAAGGAIMLPQFLLGGLGGGDVKLVAATGAWLGPWPVFQVFLAAAVVGMLLVLGQSVMQGRLRVLLRNSAMVVINLVNLQRVGVRHARATGESCRSVDQPLPYAVPVLLATLALLIWRGGGGT